MVEQIQASGARVVVLGAPPDLQSCASGLGQPADCADDLCPAFVDSTPVFADGVHMTAEYSERIGGSVARGATGELTAGPSP